MLAVPISDRLSAAIHTVIKHALEGMCMLFVFITQCHMVTCICSGTRFCLACMHMTCSDVHHGMAHFCAQGSPTGLMLVL